MVVLRHLVVGLRHRHLRHHLRLLQGEGLAVYSNRSVARTLPKTRLLRLLQLWVS